jgi:hypothetical protein
MKGMLKFDLDDHFDKLAFARATSATDVYLVIYELQDFLRSHIKYGNNDKLQEIAKNCPEGSVEDVLEVVRDSLFEILEKYNINMDNLE